MKKILFPTAYSTSSKNTWRYVLRLAQHFEARITLMHVYKDTYVSNLPDIEFLEEDMIDNFTNFDADKFEEEQIRLHNFAIENTPKQYDSLPMNFKVFAGNVSMAILQEEQKYNYDLLVLGTVTTNRFSDTLFGSTSLKVLAQAKTPIFLVPPMANYHGINKIVYASNFQSDDVVAIRHLMEWSEAFNAKLHLLHVNKNTVGSKQATEKMEKMRSSFEEADEAGTIYMIALTTHKRGFFAQLFDSSITNQIATKALVPILIFKEG
jgi:nucleotide-binding universal stress UspA family protein